MIKMKCNKLISLVFLSLILLLTGCQSQEVDDSMESIVKNSEQVMSERQQELDSQEIEKREEMKADLEFFLEDRMLGYDIEKDVLILKGELGMVLSIDNEEDIVKTDGGKEYSTVFMDLTYEMAMIVLEDYYKQHETTVIMQLVDMETDEVVGYYDGTDFEWK